MSTTTVKAPAFLVRYRDKRPVLATLHTQDQILHVIEVSIKGGHKYALGLKQNVSYCWVIEPTDKATLWKNMQERWDITVAGFYLDSNR